MNYLLLSFVVVAFFATGEALKCYECSSLWNTTCSDPFDASSMTAVSFPAGCVCLKATLEAPNGTLYARSCVKEPTITRSLDPAQFATTFVSYSEHYCDTDLCNGSSSIIATLSTLMVLFIIVIFIN